MVHWEGMLLHGTHAMGNIPRKKDIEKEEELQLWFRLKQTIKLNLGVMTHSLSYF